MSSGARLPAGLAGLAAALAVGCGERLVPDTAPGVSWTLARYRSATISDLRYEIRFSIPDSLTQPIRGHEVVRFRLSDASEPLVFDFEQPDGNVLSVRVDDQDVAYEMVNGHLVVPPEVLTGGEMAAEIEFIAGESSLNRNADYLYTLFVPDRARFAFPSFDQPDLKARYSLTLEVPAGWVAVANGRELSHEIEGDGAVYVFGETRPISTYLFSFAAGVFQVETARLGDREMRMYHRETDSTRVARTRDAIFELHGAALDWLETYTGIPYPFDKFEFVLIPSFQFGGMEHPGAVLYRAERLLLDESATRRAELGRASLIAHETSHMWFGDLVTMRWFDDVWTKEVFANFMAAKIVNPSFPDLDHELRFLLTHYPAAYEVDRTTGANPIRQELNNLNEAGSLYGAIIYQKAPIVMRQLEGLVGEERFRDGLREYLSTFRFANATWPDLVGILDSRSTDDLSEWSAVWVEEARRPTIRTSHEPDGAGRIGTLSLDQADPAAAGRVWNQRLNVLLAYPHTTRSFVVRLGSPSLRVEEAVGLPLPDFVLANGLGIGYGLFQPDDASLEFLLGNLPALPEGLTRGVAWLTLWDAMLEGRVSPGRIIDLALAMLATESDELIIQRVLDDLASAYWRFVPEAERASRAPQIESLLWNLMEGAKAQTLKSSYFGAFRSLALTDSALARLYLVWRGHLEIEGLSHSERDQTSIALYLALQGVAGAERVLEEQLGRIENQDRRDRFIFVRPAVSSDPRERDRFFASLGELHPAQPRDSRGHSANGGHLLPQALARCHARWT